MARYRYIIPEPDMIGFNTYQQVNVFRLFCLNEIKTYSSEAIRIEIPEDMTFNKYPTITGIYYSTNDNRRIKDLNPKWVYFKENEDKSEDVILSKDILTSPTYLSV